MTQSEWKNIFGDNLAAMLQERGMTQSQLAKDAGVSVGRISECINKRVIPTIPTIINIAYALDVDVNELIDFDERVY